MCLWVGLTLLWNLHNSTILKCLHAEIASRRSFCAWPFIHRCCNQHAVDQNLLEGKPAGISRAFVRAEPHPLVKGACLILAGTSSGYVTAWELTDTRYTCTLVEVGAINLQLCQQQ